MNINQDIRAEHTISLLVPRFWPIPSSATNEHGLFKTSLQLTALSLTISKNSTHTGFGNWQVRRNNCLSSLSKSYTDQKALGFPYYKEISEFSMMTLTLTWATFLQLVVLCAKGLKEESLVWNDNSEKDGDKGKRRYGWQFQEDDEWNSVKHLPEFPSIVQTKIRPMQEALYWVNTSSWKVFTVNSVMKYITSIHIRNESGLYCTSSTLVRQAKIVQKHWNHTSILKIFYKIRQVS